MESYELNKFWLIMVDMKITVEFSQILGIFTTVSILYVLRKSLISRGLLC